MVKVFAINGSPRKEKGNTAALLVPFLRGMTDAGAEVDLVYAAQLEVKPCTGEMHCWYKKPGAGRIVSVSKSSNSLLIILKMYLPVTM